MDPKIDVALRYGHKIFETEPAEEREEGDFEASSLEEEYQYADDLDGLLERPHHEE
jgi:hypothetical protein